MATTYGTAHIFGITSGSVSNATVLDFSYNSAPEVQASTLNATGTTIERRYDGEVVTGQIRIKIQSGYSEPDPGDNLSYASVYWEITEVAKEETQNDFQVYTLSLLRSAGVDSSSGA